MKQREQLTILNYLLPVVMIFAGLWHYVKHGLDLVTIVPVVLGTFALYMALFNHLLLQRTLNLLTKLWYPIGQLITVLLLTITFYIVFAPVGLVLRLLKKDILNKNFKTDRLSYWLDRSKREPNNYTQQF
jgi:hypothetical protein